MIAKHALMIVVAAGVIHAGSHDVTADEKCELPPGRGQELVVVVCLGCHGVEKFFTVSKTEQEWRRTLDDMVMLGAEIFVDELGVIAAYLTIHFGPKKDNMKEACSS